MAVAGLSREQLLDADFIEAVHRLRIVARRVPRGGRYAEQISQDLGGGTDFRDFRPYSPGDDFRSIDWNIYRRLGKAFLRLYEELEDLPLYLMPDVSDSMFLEDPPRIVPALRSALALAAISLNQHDAVGVFPFADDTEVLMPPKSGFHQLTQLADRLVEVTSAGNTSLVNALQGLSRYQLRQGLLVIVSDFFDPAGIEDVLQALKRVRHRLLLIQLMRRSDRHPDVSGDVRLIDCESQQPEDVSVTPNVIERYQAAYDRFQNSLTDFVKKRKAGLLQIDADQPIIPQLAELFEAGRYDA